MTIDVDTASHLILAHARPGRDGRRVAHADVTHVVGPMIRPRRLAFLPPQLPMTAPHGLHRCIGAGPAQTQTR